MSYYGFTVTDAGRELIAKIVAGSKNLTISRIMVGKGICSDDTPPNTLTDLVDSVAQATSNMPTYDGKQVHLTVEYRSDLNDGLKEGFWLSEFGVFADDPDDGEVMFCYGCLGEYPQWVNPASSTGVDIRRFPVIINVGEDIEISVDYNCDGWMTADEITNYFETSIIPNIKKEILPEVQKAQEDAAAATSHRYILNVPASGWTENEDGSYSQTLEVPGITAASEPGTGLYALVDSEITADEWQELSSAVGSIGRIHTDEGSVTLTCYSGTPEVDIKKLILTEVR